MFVSIEESFNHIGPDESFALTYIDDYVISDNTLPFTINRSKHKAFSSITATTPFKMEAYITKSINNLNTDTFPDVGYTTPSSGLMDNSDGVDYSDENTLELDILDVSVVVTED